MEKSVLTDIDLDGTPHLVGRLWARAAEERKRVIRVRSCMVAKSSPLFFGACA
jgi:hypothetical protein